MKKTIIIIFMVLALLMTSTVPALALGNDFTLTPAWYKAVLNNTHINANLRNGESLSFKPIDDSYTYVSQYFLNLDGTLVGGIYEPRPFTYIEYGFENDRSSPRQTGIDWISFNSPMSVNVLKNQTFDFQIVMLCGDQLSSSYYNLSGTVRLNFSDGSYYSLSSPELNKLYYENAQAVSLSLNTSGVVTSIDAHYSGEAVVFNCSWLNNTSSDKTITSVTTSYSNAYTSSKLPITGFCFGFLSEAENNNVSLPSYVEENLINIGNTLSEQSDKLTDVLTELDEIQIQLNTLIESAGSSSSTTNNYYNTITEPTESDEERQEEILKQIAEAEEAIKVLEENEADLQKRFDDLSSDLGTVDAEIKNFQDAFLTDDSTKSFFEHLFNMGILSIILPVVLGLATVSYVLFGKRG